MRPLEPITGCGNTLAFPPQNGNNRSNVLTDNKLINPLPTPDL
jgi:hypothetical protein